MAHKGNPYHDRLGRFTTASDCCCVTLQRTTDDMSSVEKISIKERNAKISAYSLKCFKQQYKKEIENGAKVLIYSNGDSLRYGIVNIADIDSRTTETGGSSTEIQNNSIPTSGYMIAFDTSRETWLTKDESDDAEKRKIAISEFAEKNKDILTKPNMHLGTWRDPNSGRISLDISERETDIKKATAKGKERNQRAIFDLRTGENIDTGGTGNNFNE